jgi:2-polyprenyl-3-methyl-5-hydroxy-6-metoxy-1,4-benzoquinol methylase
MVSRKQLLKFLSENEGDKLKGLNKLKVLYRPYICPFDDLLNIIPPQKSIFDIGCGSGTFLSLCAGFTNPTKLGGIEISATLIENAKILLRKFNIPSSVTVFDGAVFPEEINQYDVITLIDVLHHVPKAQQEIFLTTIFDKMKSGATFILKDIDAASIFVYTNKVHDLLLAKEIGHEWKASRVEEKLKKLGFIIKSTSKKRMLWYPHYTIVVEKK